jgi:hypothetical protein
MTNQEIIQEIYTHPSEWEITGDQGGGAWFEEKEGRGLVDIEDNKLSKMEKCQLLAIARSHGISFMYGREWLINIPIISSFIFCGLISINTSLLIPFTLAFITILTISLLILTRISMYNEKKALLFLGVKEERKETASKIKIPSMKSKIIRFFKMIFGSYFIFILFKPEYRFWRHLDELKAYFLSLSNNEIFSTILYIVASVVLMLTISKICAKLKSNDK